MDKDNVVQWFRMYNKSCLELALKGLHGRDYDVLFAMLSFLGYSNIISVTQSAIAGLLGIPQQSVSVAIKRLVDKQIIMLVTNKGRCNYYRLNGEFGLKGFIAKKFKGDDE